MPRLLPDLFTGIRGLDPRLVYRLLKHGEDYVAQGMAEYEQVYRERAIQNLLRKAKALGYKLLPITEGTAQTPAV